MRALLILPLVLAGCMEPDFDFRRESPHSPEELAALRDAVALPPGGTVDRRDAWTISGFGGEAVLALVHVAYPNGTDVVELGRALEAAAVEAGWTVVSRADPTGLEKRCYGFFATRDDLKLVGETGHLLLLSSPREPTPGLRLTVYDSAADRSHCPQQ